MKKKHEDFLDELFEEICFKYPPPKNTMQAFKAFIDVQRPYPLNKVKWVSWEKVYNRPGFTPRQILENLLKVKEEKITKFILPKKPKDPFMHLREADKIFFDPESVLKQFNIDMPSGIFKLDLISYLGDIGSFRRKINSDRKLKRLFSHCLRILSSIEDEFFNRFKKEKKNHQRAVDIIFGMPRGSEEGKQVTRESLRRHIKQVREFLNNGKIPRSGNFYTNSIFYYVACLMKAISDLRRFPKYPKKDESKKRATQRIYENLSGFWPWEQMEIIEGIYNQLKKSNLRSIPLEKLILFPPI